jgi:hypothetical protein
MTVAAWTRLLRNQRSECASVLLFGQSNAVCFWSAWTLRLYRPSDRSFDFKFLISRKRFPGRAIVVRSEATGADTISPALAEAFDKHAVLSESTETWLVSAIVGNAYNLIGLFQPEPPFDFVHPALPALAVRSGVPVLPYEAVRGILERAVEQTRRFYACLPRQNVAGVLHVEAPPPIPSEAQCRQSMDGSALRRALGRPDDARISPPEFRMKLWRCQSDIHRKICEEHGVHYVTPPEEALDPDGYLLPKAWSGATHASAWYGALALRKIEQIITDRRRAMMSPALSTEAR